MIKFIFRRLLSTIPIVLGVTLLTFILLHNSTDIVDIMELNRGIAYSEATKLQIRHELGLDQPIYLQYMHWLFNMLCGNLGQSFISGKDVFTLFIQKLPATLYLTISALLLTLVISFPLGIYCAFHENKFSDQLLRYLTFIGNAMPGFCLALLLIYVFSVRLNFLPVVNNTALSSIILPSFTLAIPMSAKYIRQIRTIILEQLQQDYVFFAKAHGMSLYQLLFPNIIKMSILPLITLITLSFGSLLGGSAIVESIFMWDGVGKLAIDAINLRDYPIILAYTFYLALIYIVINLFADILYHYLDPRLQHILRK